MHLFGQSFGNRIALVYEFSKCSTIICLFSQIYITYKSVVNTFDLYKKNDFKNKYENTEILYYTLSIETDFQDQTTS